jgi:hypothetical protein
MRVSIEVPEPKAGLDAALAKQFADLQRQLMGLVKEQNASKSSLHSMMLECLEDQQTKFLKAMDSMMGMVQHTVTTQAGGSDALAEALSGLKRSLAELPGDLKEALDRSYAKVQRQLTMSSPSQKVSVQVPTKLMHKIDSLEQAFLSRPTGVRNRTFGSNY